LRSAWIQTAPPATASIAKAMRNCPFVRGVMVARLPSESAQRPAGSTRTIEPRSGSASVTLSARRSVRYLVERSLRRRARGLRHTQPWRRARATTFAQGRARYRLPERWYADPGPRLRSLYSITCTRPSDWFKPDRNRTSGSPSRSPLSANRSQLAASRLADPSVRAPLNIDWLIPCRFVEMPTGSSAGEGVCPLDPVRCEPTSAPM
jgi:hypothetical protein